VEVDPADLPFDLVDLALAVFSQPASNASTLCLWELLESGQHLSHGHLALRPYPNQRMRVIY
jgi:hypothetical protein